MGYNPSGEGQGADAMTTRSAPSVAKPLIQLLVFLGTTLAVPAVLVRTVHPYAGEERTTAIRRTDPDAERKRLVERKPDWIMIGNSMLNTRIDQDDLSRLSGLRVTKLTEGGSQSAVWFLFLKRIVQESGVKPRWITVFFRETDLTWPDLRLGGSNEELIKLLDGHTQPEWKQVFERRNVERITALRDVPDFVSERMATLLGSEDWRKWSRGRLQSIAFEATEFGGGMPHRLRRAELNERFSLDHLRHDLGADTALAAGAMDLGTPGGVAEGAGNSLGVYENGPSEFDGSSRASFLPHMIAVAKQTGARVHFHRVKRRRSAEEGIGDSAGMIAYMKDLRRYLESEGCALSDESDDPEITSDLYADGDHITREPKRQRRYIELFWKRVGPVITGGAAKENNSTER